MIFFRLLSSTKLAQMDRFPRTMSSLGCMRSSGNNQRTFGARLIRYIARLIEIHIGIIDCCSYFFIQVGHTAFLHEKYESLVKAGQIQRGLDEDSPNLWDVCAASKILCSSLDGDERRALFAGYVSQSDAARCKVFPFSAMP